MFPFILLITIQLFFIKLFENKEIEIFKYSGLKNSSILNILSIEMRRLAYSLGSLLSINEVLECSRKLNEIKPEVMWIPETWGMENFSILGLAAKENTFSKIANKLIS